MQMSAELRSGDSEGHILGKSLLMTPWSKIRAIFFFSDIDVGPCVILYEDYVSVGVSDEVL